jgi:hypothetical protein
MAAAPWVHHVSKDWVNIYAPFEELDPQVMEACIPSVLTHIDLTEPGQQYQRGINTSLKSVHGLRLIYNTAYLGPSALVKPYYQNYRVKSKQRTVSYGKDPEDTLIRRVCLMLSDIIYIEALNLNQAASEMVSWADSQRLNKLCHVPSFSVVIKHRGNDHVSGDTVLLCREMIRQRYPEMHPVLRKYLNACLAKASIKFQTPYRKQDAGSVCAQLADDLWHLRNRRIKTKHGWSLNTCILLVDKFCASILSPAGNPFRFASALREAHWPGTLIYKENVLEDWIQLVISNPALSGAIAPILANLFLQDARELSHGK